ncbi:MAG: hypothetical protein ACI9XK_004504 [Granulosicoccus sp.]|jgi:hypothetical protein
MVVGIFLGWLGCIKWFIPPLLEKWKHKVKSINGRDSVFHYVRNPKTGLPSNFKFKNITLDIKYVGFT